MSELLVIMTGFLYACSAIDTGRDTSDRRNRSVRVAMAQIPIKDGDLAENMRLASAAARASAAQKADMVCLPEVADWGWLYQEARRDALPIPGRYTDLLSKLASQYRMWVSAGCLERDGEHVYDSAVIIDRGGRIVLKHRKIKTLPELTKDLYDAGSVRDIKTVDTEFGRIGLTICADNFDPEIPKRVAQLGAWLLVAPHGFAAPEDGMEQNSIEYQRHIRKVAAEAKLWVIGTDAVVGRVKGGAWKGRLHSGSSMIARPDGTAAIIAKFKQPDLVVYDIPLGGTKADSVKPLPGRKPESAGGGTN